MNERKKSTSNLNISLVGEVNGDCPLCGQPLMYKKNGDNFKGYEIAHIYPLNPLPNEIILLENEERLSIDVNDEKNLIPLCNSCHPKFDTPRTVEEYLNLVAMKKAILEQIAEKIIWEDYPLKESIKTVVAALSQIDDTEIIGDLQLDPKTVDDKTYNKIPNIIRIKIKNHVRNYYPQVKNEFTEIEKQQPGLSTHISLQVKLYCEDQQLRGLSQSVIYRNIVEWMHIKTARLSHEACEIIVSFFVQNCEVFS